MCMLPQLTQARLNKQIESAAAVLLSPSHRYQYTPTELARMRGIDPSTVYRRTHALLRQMACPSSIIAENDRLTAENEQLQARIHLLEADRAPYQTGHCLKVTPERLALTVLESTTSTKTDGASLSNSTTTLANSPN